MFTFLIAFAALVVASLAYLLARQASDKADDDLRFLSDLKNRSGGDFRDLFREVYRLKALQLKAAGKLDYKPYEIIDSCIACGACEPECPVEAIRPGDAYRIMPDVCTACGQCAEVCPVKACVEMEI